MSIDDPGEYIDGVAPIAGPVRIKYLYNVGCIENSLPVGAPPARSGAEADIVIVDAQNNIVLNTTAGIAQYSASDWTADYKIYEWVTARATCRLVAHVSWLAGDADTRNYSRYLAPENATLDARAVHKLPKRVLSISVRQKNGELVDGPYRGDLVFRNGYNTTLEAENPTINNFRINTRINIAAEAGSGVGYYPVCDAIVDEETSEIIPQPVRRINGVNGDEYGDFLLSATDCLYVRRPTTSPAEGTIVPSTTAQLQIGADCGPCCKCEEFVSVANYMNTIQNKYKEVGRRAAVAQQTHAENVDKWLEKIRCAANNPLKLTLTPQACPVIDAVMMICNPCDTCLPGVPLTLTVDQPAELVPGHTGLYAKDINGRPAPITTTTSVNYLGNQTTSFTVDMPPVGGGGTAYLTMRLKFERKPLVVNGTLTADLLTGCENFTAPSARQPASASATTALYCNDAGETTRPS